MNRPPRVLFAWELGASYGHLARAAAVAQRLRAEGCDTLVAARDVESAHSLLTPVGIEFVAAPRYRGTKFRPRAPVNYSDLLGECGYLDSTALRALLRAWINLLQAVAPDVVIVDHAPTALLAAKALAIPRVVIGTGFTVPPAADPMPALRTGVTDAQLAAADAKSLGCINEALKAVAQPPLSRVADLFVGAPAMITTFRELDHYRSRDHETFVGPVSPLRQLPSVSWPGGGGTRVLAYLNADFRRLAETLSALRESDAQVVCVIPGVEGQVVRRSGSDRFRICDFPADIGALLPEATLVVTHGGAGLTAQALAAGVPLLVIPQVVEQDMSAMRVAELGAALVVGEQRSSSDMTKALVRMLGEPSFTQAARSLASKLAHHDSQRAVDAIAQTVVQVARHLPKAVSA